MSGLSLAPVRLRDARAFIAQHHRHNPPPHAWLFGVGVCSQGDLVGVAVAARPVSRGLDDGATVEVVRVATDGSRNANSMLYGAVCRAAKALGYTLAITYTLDSESGSSLRAVGFVQVATLPGSRSWDTPTRPRPEPLFGPSRYPQHDGHKIRWERAL